MALIPARARGTRLQLLAKAETTVGTKATGAYAQLPCYSFDMSAQQPQVEDPVLSYGIGRNPMDPFPDALTLKGNAKVPLETGNIDFWLTLLFGTKVTTGTTTKTDTWTAGGALPSATFEKGLLDTVDFYEFDGVFADTLGIDIAPSGTATMTVGLAALTQQPVANASIGGTPTRATYGRLLNKSASVLLDSTAVANVTGGTLSISNNLEEVRTVRGDTTGAPAGYDAGELKLDGKLSLRYDSRSMTTAALANAPHTLSLQWPLTGGYLLSFNFPRCFIETPSVPIAGPGGIEQTINIKAAYDATAAAAFTVTMTHT
ncbi:phage tail tube protein [Limobrevibacterium gyesilva]|uniref:Phage tail tube protein n=1 Tax=Limobrevibacterium gyesilva TaxID=2991712 RepID=A0AA42CFP5_9PROT|nr:phage tail tube protein [Limobrevibacterium gyesilva]MCW3477363.1 phage tail tube protein [Limobrevibacterium gyesilva]